jgi:ABC-type uncharacterized transport system substrate-binding protein
LPLVLLFGVLPVCTADVLAADILIIGDLQFRQVADVTAEIKATVRPQVKELSTADVKGRLESVVVRENARIVVALGSEALAEALRLPTSIPVIYGLVIAPPRTARANTTGVYMAAPVNEYTALTKRYLPAMYRFSVVGSNNLMSHLLGVDGGGVTAYRVGSSPELMNAINRVTNSHAILLLPDAALLTASVMEDVFLYSFRNNVPVLGVSEGNVKQGSLFALVFEPKGVGRQIGEILHKILQRVDAGDIPPTPPRKFNLFINTNTAKKMSISLPDEMLNRARKIYP